MAEPHLSVDVLIRQIHASSKGCVAIDDGDLSMIPVILVGGKHRADGRKHFAADPLSLQRPGIMERQKHQTAHTVIHHPNLDSRPGFFLQDFHDLIPHIPPVNDKKLHKNELFGPLEFFHEPLEHILSQRKIFCICIFIHRETGCAAQIVHQPGHTPVAGL